MSGENYSREQVEQLVREVCASFNFISADEIPKIDLYMDQVLTFMGDRLRFTTRDPENDKILTKTMINNYVKNKVLIPPVKKKYGTDHILLLMVIYYMKNFLSIDDIQRIISPVAAKYARPTTKSAEPKSGRKHRYTLSEIYTEVFGDISIELERLPEDVRGMLDETENAFLEAPKEDREMLRRFDLICQLSAGIYLRKLLIEKLVDEMPRTDESSVKSGK